MTEGHHHHDGENAAHVTPGEGEGLHHRGGEAAPPPKPAKPATVTTPSGRQQRRGPGEGFASNFIRSQMPNILRALFGLERAVSAGVQVYGQAEALYEQQLSKLRDYNPKAVVGMGTGLLLSFFGGFFIVTVAMYEAFHQAGADILYKNVDLLSQQLRNVKAAEEADEKADDDGDGVPDVQQITKEELAERKLVVAIKAVDPAVVQSALAALWTATLSAACTVKLQFARTIALGVSIGNTLNRPVQRYLVPILESVMPEYMHRWLVSSPSSPSASRGGWGRTDGLCSGRSRARARTCAA